jgi:hypothetical protein
MRHFILFLSGILILSMQSSFGQLRFKLSLDEDLKTYKVSAISEKDLYKPDSYLGTAQVTFKVSVQSSFKITNIQTKSSEVFWDVNSVINAHPLAPQYIYYSIGLRSETDFYTFKANEPVELFSFQNKGDDNPMIELITNQDILAKSMKVAKANIGNQINVLGINNGMTNAYVGNYLSEGGNSDIANLQIQQVYPNPATDKISVVWENRLQEPEAEMNLYIIDSQSGRVVQSQGVDTGYGKKLATVALNDYKSGAYLLKIQGKQFSSKAAHFTIVK